jgi:hypothetical protein
LYDEGYTIKGVQKLFKEQGVQALSAVALPLREPSSEPDAADAPGLPPAQEPGVKEAPSRIADDELAALREALTDIAEAQRILAHASAPAS